MVWSSRCRVNFAALATFVSFSTAILQQRIAAPCCQVTMASDAGLPIYPAVTWPSTRRALQLSLLDALGHHKALIAIGRICHGTLRTCLARRTTKLEA